MKTLQAILRNDADVDVALGALFAMAPDLVLVFGALPFFESRRLGDTLRRRLPHAIVAGCSTAGEIAVDRVYDGTCVVTAVCFERTPLAIAATAIDGMGDSFLAGGRLAAQLAPHELSAVLLFGTGVAINGSALVAGLQSALPDGVTISGGLAADGGAFRQTWTLGPHGAAADQIVAVGLYGKAIRLAYGSCAGWQAFGPARKVTRCDNNVLYELDGQRALDVYQSYLGDYATGLPASGLLFPFEMLDRDRQSSGTFRTIIGMNEKEGALILAGDIDPDGYLKLMHSSVDKLVEGAETAVRAAQQEMGAADGADALAILVSCVGRKLVMGDRIDEEVEAVASALGKSTTVAGFYSNGEIAGSRSGQCSLKNQTMTITWMLEA